MRRHTPRRLRRGDRAAIRQRKSLAKPLFIDDTVTHVAPQNFPPMQIIDVKRTVRVHPRAKSNTSLGTWSVAQRAGLLSRLVQQIDRNTEEL